MVSMGVRESSCWRRTFLLVALAQLSGMAAAQHRAPEVAPVITRENWCVAGTPTRTTGECMCRWANADACQGPRCQYEYGLAWHHHTCEDCHCVPKPWDGTSGTLRRDKKQWREAHGD